MKVVRLSGPDLDDALDDIAKLRIGVFRDWPYLYDGDPVYEQNYLQTYRLSEKSIVVGAYDGNWLVGASTGAPLVDHASDFAEAFDGHEIDVEETFYCGESVLLRPYRGRGIGKKFFDLREAHAKQLGFQKICFCAVIRDRDHPLFPALYRPLDGFWKSRGYEPLEGVIARFSWKDIDQENETTKRLQFWMRSL